MNSKLNIQQPVAPSAASVRYQNQRFGEEHALYESHGVRLTGCSFDGPEDGESALKESSDIIMENGFCNLRYPFWHDARLLLDDCEMTETCRAALWYSTDVDIHNCRMHGIKALRECQRVRIQNSSIQSAEFGWFCSDLQLQNTVAQGEYFLLRSQNLQMHQVDFKGKYSFQYLQNALIEDCTLDTKDAFWHAKNVTVRNCVVRGEYLAWYSENLTLQNCKIIGTQPLCYCKGLRLIDCTMEQADLAFEKSEVEATLSGHVISIKNPSSGHISLDSLDELILTDPYAKAQVCVKSEK